MQGYVNYFTEIEEHFCRRRGSHLICSTLDWSLMETWKDAGIPLEAVLRGIDETFDRYDQRKSKLRKINSLAYCSQAVLTAAEDMQEAATGTQPAHAEAAGISGTSIAAYLTHNAGELTRVAAALPAAVQSIARDTAAALEQLGAASAERSGNLEDLERRLTMMEEKLFAALVASASDDLLVKLRSEADRELAPFRRKMPAAQIDQLQRQYVHKRLLEQQGLPRLSLFYMP